MRQTRREDKLQVQNTSFLTLTHIVSHTALKGPIIGFILSFFLHQTKLLEHPLHTLCQMLVRSGARHVERMRSLSSKSTCLGPREKNMCTTSYTAQCHMCFGRSVHTMLQVHGCIHTTPPGGIIDVPEDMTLEL